MGTSPESGGGDGLFVAVDLGVGEATAVIEDGVDEPVAGGRALHPRCLAATVNAPAATGRDARDLLDIDMDQLTGPLALIAARPLPRRGPVTAIEPAKAFTVQDRLHRRG